MKLQSQKTIHLMVGNVGCGKTTTVERLLKELDNQAFVLNDDALARILNPGLPYGNEMWSDARWEAYRRIMESMARTILARTEFDVIIDSPLMSNVKRRPFEQLAFNLNCRIKIYLHRTPGGLERRIADDRGTDAETWKRVFDALEAEYEPPTIVGITKEIIDCSWKEDETCK